MTIGELEDARADAVALQDKIGRLADDDEAGPQLADVLGEAAGEVESAVMALDFAVRLAGPG